MSLSTTYDSENIFAKIISGDMPSVRVFEDDDILSFMDIFPASEGHTLVISKTAKATNLLDIEVDQLQTLIAGTQRVAKAIETSLGPDGIRLVQFNGEPAGQTVFHLHFHIIPVYGEAPLNMHGTGDPLGADVLEPIAAKIRAAF
ncbi:MAG: HIT family protein [Pseudomonadota bacterium]